MTGENESMNVKHFLVKIVLRGSLMFCVLALLACFVAFSSSSASAAPPVGFARIIHVAPADRGVGAAVVDSTVTIAPQTPYTLAALGTTATGYSLKTFVDNNLLTTGKNMAKVRVYHLSPNAGPVNVAARGRMLIGGLVYPNASDYLTVPAGSYTFSVRATRFGATIPAQAMLRADTVTSVFAIGMLRGMPEFRFVTTTIPAVPSGAMVG